ncbi:MAG: hypothetical protein PHH28_01915 [Desulfuromonadaceae bacterium]|nr:hypothetical protein [Desulfuromonadaceae bacterium]
MIFFPINDSCMKRSRPYFPLLLLVALMAIGQSSLSWADDTGYFPDKQGEWQYRPASGYGTSYGLTTKQTRSFNDRLNAIERIVGEAGVFNPPLGFQARARSEIFEAGCAESSCKGKPVRGRLTVILYYFVEHDGEAAWGGEANTSFELRTNDRLHVFGRRYSLSYEGLRLPDGREIFFSPQETARVAGFPVYDGNLLIFTSKAREVWIPLTREQYLKALISLRQQELSKAEEDSAKLKSSDPYRDWLSKRPQRLKDNERAYQRLKKIDPVRAEKLRATLQQTEDEMGTRLKNSVPVSASSEIGFEFFKERIETLKNELAAMTPTERKTQARIINDHNLGSGLVAAQSSEGRLLVTLNPDYFDSSRPATDIQLVSVLFDFEGPSTTHIGNKRLSEALFGIDWTRIAVIAR